VLHSETRTEPPFVSVPVRADYLEMTTGGNVRSTDYDPILSEDTLDRLRPQLESWPYGILRYSDGGSYGEMVLHADHTRQYVIILPRNVSPAGDAR
ncbi:MAG: hypothetical protein ACQERF_11555, partial [Actinomycetota bacterium]